jgi:hypothetical protein
MIPDIRALIPYIIDGIKKLSDSDLKTIATYVAQLCLSDKEACTSIYRLTLTIAYTCKNVLHGAGVGRRGEKEEER